MRLILLGLDDIEKETWKTLVNLYRDSSDC